MAVARCRASFICRFFAWPLLLLRLIVIVLERGVRSPLHVKECEYDAPSGSCEGHFCDVVRRTAGDGYVLVVTLSMLVMRMIILVKREHYHKITNVKVRWMDGSAQ